MSMSVACDGGARRRGAGDGHRGHGEEAGDNEHDRGVPRALASTGPRGHAKGSRDSHLTVQYSTNLKTIIYGFWVELHVS